MDDSTEHPLSKLTPDEIDELKEMLLESIYADIGRNVVRKLLWIAAAVISTLFVWLSSKHV
jgi:hypothetical protein